MGVRLAPISVADAKAYFEKHSAYRGEFTFAIAAESDEGRHGVIAMIAEGGDVARLGQVSTDGNAQVGSLLYGGAWRACKALGYKSIEI